MSNRQEKTDRIWKALADGTRREILDVLAERPCTTGELVARFDHVCRTNVMKHLGVLVDANLVIVRRDGRVRWNHLNPTPIQAVCDRWVSKHVKGMASSLARLKEHVEEREINGTRKSNRTKAKSKSEKAVTRGRKR